MTTFTFEGRYNDGGGPRTDIIVAPDRDTAIRLAALAIITVNDWNVEMFGHPAFCSTYQTLAELHEDQIDILSEWTDLDGKACPNCTAHGGRDTMQDFAGSGGMIHECEACGYHWVPLGMKLKPAEPTAAEINAALDAWELEHMRKDDADD